MWASNRFVLDLLDITAVGRPVIDRLILTAITQANVRSITYDPEQQLAYAGLDQPPPEHVRTAISTNAVSAMLSLPFETTRRRIRRLIIAGDCVTTSEGLRVPVRALSSPDHERTLLAAYDLTQDLYLRLRTFDDLGRLRPPERDGAPRTAPVRGVARLIYDHLLRVIEAVGPVADNLTTALLLLTAWRENTEHWLGTPEGRDFLLADHKRQPVTVSTLAKRLGLSETTTYRRLRAARKKGWCHVSSRGAIVPGSFLSRGEFEEAMRFNHSSLFRLFDALSRLGVLENWDSGSSQDGLHGLRSI